MTDLEDPIATPDPDPISEPPHPERSSLAGVLGWLITAALATGAFFWGAWFTRLYLSRDS